MVFLASGFATAGYADDNSGAYYMSVAHNSQHDVHVLINQIPDCLSRIKSWPDGPLFSFKTKQN